MKTLFSFILITISFNLFSQTQVYDVKTPNYNTVIAWQMLELTDATRAYIDNKNHNDYPNAQMIYTYQSSSDPNVWYSSTGRFNCHGYAWYMSQSGLGLNLPRWIGRTPNNEDEFIYWEDESYIEIQSMDHPCIISYDPDVSDHSAISQSTLGKVVSKWGDGAFMYHDWDDCPYMSGSPELIYYELNCSRVIENQTISNDHSLYGCDVQLTNVTVGSNVDLNISFDDWAQINGEFLVPIGSTLNITP